MKVAITSTGNTIGDKVDARFGRCNYFAIYDTESQETEFINNPYKEVDEGAGPGCVRLIASFEVKKAVAGEFGMKIKSLMNETGIQMITMKEEKTIGEIISLLKHE
ncbi:MAG: hypothetical protein LKI39_09435 [Bacteroides sp.]|jgi:predicted Fe-Mo cluster-binding NifX family protein|nr:hypothetical protein [Bacteroides sp.]